MWQSSGGLVNRAATAEKGESMPNELVRVSGTGVPATVTSAALPMLVERAGAADRFASRARLAVTPSGPWSHDTWSRPSGDRVDREHHEGPIAPNFRLLRNRDLHVLSRPCAPLTSMFSTENSKQRCRSRQAICWRGGCHGVARSLVSEWVMSHRDRIAPVCGR